MTQTTETKKTVNPAMVYPFYVGVWLLLLALTGITLLSSLFDLGRLNILVALTIAAIKGALVVLFFMHLKEESPIFTYFFLITLSILAIFIGLTFFDVAFR